MRSLCVASFVFVSIALAAGCSSASSAPQTGAVSGAVASAPLKTLSAVARPGTYFVSSGGPAKGLRILFSDKANDCTVTHFSSATMIDVRIRDDSPAPGSYPIVSALAKTPGAKEAEADFNAVDGSCKDLVAQNATQGSVTLKTVELQGAGAHVAGSFDATYPGGHVAGDFDAVVCEGTDDPGAVGQDAGAPVVCTP